MQAFWYGQKGDETVRDTKLLFLSSARELYNDFIENPEERGFYGTINDYSQVLISANALRKHMPSYLKNIPNRHKQINVWMPNLHYF